MNKKTKIYQSFSGFHQVTFGVIGSAAVQDLSFFKCSTYNETVQAILPINELDRGEQTFLILYTQTNIVSLSLTKRILLAHTITC